MFSPSVRTQCLSDLETQAISRGARGLGGLASPAVPLAVIGLLWGATLVAAQGGFSVRDVLSSPHPSGLSAAPVGGHVAWVFNDQGNRDLWIASPSNLQEASSDAAFPAYASRRVTDLANQVGEDRGHNDDGQEIGSIAWSPAAQSLAFVRGGPPNASGELPNPLSLPGGVERAVWRLDVATGSYTKVGPGHSPLWLGERTLLLVLAGAVVKVEFARRARRGAPKHTETELLSVRGGLGGLQLSPDRRRLAFVSSRGDHSYVGVLDLEDGRGLEEGAVHKEDAVLKEGIGLEEGAVLKESTVRFLDPSVDRDGSPVFSPDGNSVAFLRLPPLLRPEIFAPAREGAPWSIRVVELATGIGREVFRAEPGRGSVFRGVVADSQLVWTDDGSLVFPWERDGWTHLYSVDVGDGGQAAATPRLLTPGAFEVEYVASTADGNSVAFSSNQDDIDRRHLWRVTPESGELEQLTSGQGVENAPTPLSNGAVAYVAASGTHPLAPRLRWPTGASQPLAPRSLPDRFPLAQMVEPQQVVFTATDGMRIHGQLLLPPAHFSGERPAAIYFHGGSRRHMMLGWHYSSYYHHCYAFHQYLANQGYVVLSVNYRSGIGYGLEFREALDYGASGASELRDVLGAGLYLRGRDDVDGERIGLWGGSYGGYLTAMGLTRASDLFAAGVDIHGVHDWNRTIKNFIPSYEPLEDPERARLAFESSPMAQVEDWRSPVLLVHGDDDRNVPFTETVVLVEKLREQGVEHELLIYPDEVHSFLRHQHWVEIFERAAAFFDKHLQADEAAAAKESAVQ